MRCTQHNRTEEDRVMRVTRQIKLYAEAFRCVSRIVVFVLRKCWPQLVGLAAVTLVLDVTFGHGVAFAALNCGALYVLYSSCDWFVYHPNDPIDSRHNVLSPSALNLPFESNLIVTVDGVPINVVLIKQQNSAEKSSSPTIVYFHGNAGNIGHRLQNAYELYHKLNCNVLLVEYRGYGLSGGTPSERGLYLDGEAALDYVFNLSDIDIDRQKIIVFGRSLGGAVAIELARNGKYSEHIAGLIVENTFTSIPDIARSIFNCGLIRLLPNWYFKNQFNTMAKMSAITVPTLFVSGLSDDLIPPSMMSALFTTSASVHKQLHTFECGTHNFTWKCHNYYEIVGAFVRDVTDQSNDRQTHSPAVHQHHHQYGGQSVIIDTNQLQISKEFVI